MRINVYSQELTSEVVHVIKENDAGVTHHAAQLMLHSSPMLHHPPMDDDRSAVTFWLPKSAHRREEMARAFEAIARIFRESSLGADQTDPQCPIGTSLTRAGEAAARVTVAAAYNELHENEQRPNCQEVRERGEPKR